MSYKKDQLSYYANLLIIQYHDKFNAVNTVKSFLKNFVLENEKTKNNLLDDISNYINIDLTTGKGLDLVGKYIGFPRPFVGSKYIPDTYFGFANYLDDSPDNTTGFATYNDYDTKAGKFLNYDLVIPTGVYLEDTPYRFLLKLESIKSNIDASTGNIDESLYNIFGNDLYYEETQPMKILYYFHDDLKDFINLAVAYDLLPRTMGTQVVGAINIENKIFGFVDYNNLTPISDETGFRDYQSLGKKGVTLSYNKIL